jgi:MYXO-CTERM domain-containing protein
LPALIPGGALSGLEKDIAMESKLMKFMGAATIGSAILLSGPVLAQQSGKSAQAAQTQTAQAPQGSGSGSSSQSGNASGGQSSSIEQRKVDDDRDWGWLGLFGLIGLAGLRRRRHDHDVRRDTVRGAA